jgi:ATP-dependent DNA ligase
MTPVGRGSIWFKFRRAPMYVAFDVLYGRGENLRAPPKRLRKSVLRELVRELFIAIDSWVNE